MIRRYLYALVDLYVLVVILLAGISISSPLARELRRRFKEGA